MYERELEELIDGIDRRRTGQPGLWQRESMCGQLRSARSVAASADDGDALIARIEEALAWFAALDAEEFAEVRGRLEAGTFRPDDLKHTLEQQPLHLWDPYVRRVFDVAMPPLRDTACPRQMIDNVPTNFMTILEVADRLDEGDTLFDIGAGVGTVALMVGFLTGRPVTGVEIDPAYAEFARARAERFGLSHVKILCEDACAVDCAEATTFFLYDPFRGALLDRFLEHLHGECAGRDARILAFGKCHVAIGEQEWLELAETTPSSMRVFRTRPST